MRVVLYEHKNKIMIREKNMIRDIIMSLFCEFNSLRPPLFTYRYGYTILWLGGGVIITSYHT